MSYKEFSEEEINRIDLFFEYKNADKFSEAYEAIEPLIHIHPNNFQVNLLLGTILYSDKNYLLAEVFLKKATELKPDDYLASLTLIHSYLESSKWNTALFELKRYLFLKKYMCEEHVEFLKELYVNRMNFEKSEAALINQLYEKL